MGVGADRNAQLGVQGMRQVYIYIWLERRDLQEEGGSTCCNGTLYPPPKSRIRKGANGSRESSDSEKYSK